MKKAVYEEIQAERKRQDAKWGEQNHPSCPPYFDPKLRTNALGVLSERGAKLACQSATARKVLTFGHIAAEEFSEAIAADGDLERRGELVQLAAVIVQWIEAIDRRLVAGKGNEKK